MNKLILKSPAKLNLYLNVLRRRHDGYHDIETVFEKIALFDTLTLRPAKKGIRITTDNAALPLGVNNLAYRAAKALFDKAGFRAGVCIDISKNIPIAAGLGGGSSNAASVLMGVNRLFKMGFNRAALIDIGRTLGADVPFFLYNHSFAVGRGRGDNIYVLRYNGSNIKLWHVVVAFRFGLATKDIYNDIGHSLRLTHMPVGVRITPLWVLRRKGQNTVENLGASLYNKLEESALKKAPVIGFIKSLLLKEGAYGALLSGSGPAVFGITRTREEAIALRNRILSGISTGHKVSKVFVVETLTAA